LTLESNCEASDERLRTVRIAFRRTALLVVLVFNDREGPEPHHPARALLLRRTSLKRAANFLNEQVRGRTLGQVRAEILARSKRTMST